MYEMLLKKLTSEEFADKFFCGLISLLQNCPRDTVFLREKLLNILKASLKTSLKKNFSMFAPQLLIDSYLYNTDVVIFQSERPLYFHILINCLNHIILDLNDEVLEMIAKKILPIICDLTLPIQIQISVCHFLIKLHYHLFNKSLMLDLINSFNNRLEVFAMKELPFINEMLKKSKTFFDRKCSTLSNSTYSVNMLGDYTSCSFSSILKNPSNKKKSAPEFKNCFTICDCKNLVKTMMENSISVVRRFRVNDKREQDGNPTLDYVHPFSKLLKGFLAAVIIFRIPSTSYSIQNDTLQEEKDTLIKLSKIFCSFSAMDFCKIFLPNIDTIFNEMLQNPALQIFLQSLLFDASKTRELSALFLDFILNHLEEFDDKNKFPTLFCLLDDVLRAMLKFPQNAELLNQFLLPLIKQCIHVVTLTEEPVNVLKVIISFMAIISVGNFENIFNHSVVPDLPSILQTMITWHRTSSNQYFQDQVLDLCLSISINCNSRVLMSITQMIMAPIVDALHKNSSNFILKALKVLQHLYQLDDEFINSSTLFWKEELLYGLHHAFIISSDEAKKIISLLLTKFHDSHQNLQAQHFFLAQC
ncbi:uncharacterized protein NPIL_61621 [Nephila pilipes]|uniref:Uncharacterized protein n=1 Tax=Nephila pilipes TaxID=299642 RepID=A0A8X6TII3_NEPPI|nr:uncharacterized protein NPIL_239751 [Nephila pilipes]GFU27502.1 uncharacterized protein NPIL_61621 [Nephila pilipes]